MLIFYMLKISSGLAFVYTETMFRDAKSAEKLFVSFFIAFKKINISEFLLLMEALLNLITVPY